MDEMHFIGDPPTGEVYIGYERGLWPLSIFADAHHAASWAENGEGVRYLWRYQLIDPVPMQLVHRQTIPATLKEAEQ
jgi:hypothetical protein